MDVLRVAEIIAETEAEGPGLRSALWLQGCSLSCTGCCNPHMWNPRDGIEWNPQDLATYLASIPSEGLTVLGGEPLEQFLPLATLLKTYRQHADRSVWLFTGYSWDDVQSSSRLRATVNLCDVVIAGPFVREMTPEPRKWIGSTNQTVHFMTDRDHDLINRWPTAEYELELHFVDGEIVINGCPPATATAEWEYE